MKKLLNRFYLNSALLASLGLVVLVGSGCSHEKEKNHAKESAARYWQDKAYPGKAYDVQVTEAEDAGDGLYRVRGIVDGETRVGMFNPETETFSEGYYSLAHEKGRRVAELEQEVKYWKEKFEALEKENYKLKVRMSLPEDKASSTAPATAPAAAPAASTTPAPAQ